MVSNASSTPKKIKQFSKRLLNWYRQAGRHALPWKESPTPYRVWISEIMLQQTQVTTVMPYFARFMASFPEIKTLANASQDEVLHHWTGLGYYARARNLHKAAQLIRDQHQGIFPDDFEQVLALPGIGRSTAGAILAQAMNQSFAILDGNVKRVLTRLHMIEGWYGVKAVETRLWELAEHYTPREEDKDHSEGGQGIADYTQAIMDLGATLCTRSKPQCERCPFVKDCLAYINNRTTEFPNSKPKKAKPVRQTRMLIWLDKDKQVLLGQRPQKGIWGGLWSFPECAIDENLSDWCEHQLQLKLNKYHDLPMLRHSFSHYHLDIQPTIVQGPPVGVSESENQHWYDMQQPEALGLPAPVVQLLVDIQKWAL